MLTSHASYQNFTFAEGFPFFVMSMYEGEYNDFIYCHWHPQTEIIQVKKGNLHLEINNRSYELVQGDIAFVNPDEIHYGLEKKGSNCSISTYTFNWNALEYNSQDCFYSNYVDPLAEHRYSLKSVLKADESIEIQEISVLLDRIYKEYNQKPLLYQDIISSCLMQILIGLYRLNLVEKQQSDKNDSKNLMSIKKGIQYIQNHYRERIYFPDVAAHISVSEDYFYKAFRRTTGQTPSRFLRHIRIQQAKKLLNAEAMSISEIGEQVGYESTSYFIKQFHLETGQTPKQYRHRRVY